MLIDCQSCPAAGRHCASCAVSAFLDLTPLAPLDVREARAVSVLLEAGLISASEAAGAHAVRDEPSPVAWVG